MYKIYLAAKGISCKILKKNGHGYDVLNISIKKSSNIEMGAAGYDWNLEKCFLPHKNNGTNSKNSHGKFMRIMS